ncbi:MAG: nucleotidyltransferase domain-containing protein [Desulfobulbaceae bacterium]|nr:nucleotidyltransferase domain-containing protein [Desulfobulbaceae bacterium]
MENEKNPPLLEEAVTNAKSLWLSRYKGAEFCIAAGSIITGNGTTLSDLDLVVIYPQLESAYRESFYFADMPIETFVHDYETIQAFMDTDYEESHASIIHMIVTGIAIPKESAASAKLKKYASVLLEQGPQVYDPHKHGALRYAVTDLIDDLRGDRPNDERRAILYALYPKIGELALRHSGKFISSGKHLARKLKEHCPSILSDLETIMDAAHSKGLESKHIDQLENIVKASGGLLFEGYHQKAPKEKRATPTWLDA